VHATQLGRQVGFIPAMQRRLQIACTNPEAMPICVALERKSMTDESMIDETIIGMYDVLDALEEVVKAADPAKRAVLAEMVDGYRETFADEFFLGNGPPSPSIAVPYYEYYRLVMPT
jgi:hypothetical protein